MMIMDCSCRQNAPPSQHEKARDSFHHGPGCRLQRLRKTQDGGWGKAEDR
jgi:hypothetical protein